MRSPCSVHTLFTRKTGQERGEGPCFGVLYRFKTRSPNPELGVHRVTQLGRTRWSARHSSGLQRIFQPDDVSAAWRMWRLALLSGQPHQLRRGRLLSGRFRPLAPCHVIQCRGHDGTSPTGPLRHGVIWPKTPLDPQTRIGVSAVVMAPLRGGRPGTGAGGSIRDPGAGRVVCHGRAVRMSPGLVMAGTGGNPGSP
jgi:hypothetical protein